MLRLRKMRKIWIRMMSRRMRKTGIRVVIVATILMNKMTRMTRMMMRKRMPVMVVL